MISDERSKYKSWSNLKKQMNDLLCNSLKDKISYFYTSYHEVHNAYGRATINYNKKEMVAFSWVEMYAQEREVSQLYREGKKVSYGEMEKGKWMPECKLCDADFINSLTIYLKTDIATSLQSDNYLLRVFAYMDRRVGKRTLIKIKDDVEKLPDWVKRFYQIRCEADGIVFPPKRITDETVVLLSREKADDKKWAFFENARLLQEAFGITPLLYGSLGLEYLTGKKLNADDIDILIPKAYIAELWHEFTSVLEKNGYTLIDEHEHTFEKGGIHYAYAQIEELESFASIRMSEIATLSAGNLRFKLLSLQQYLKVYTASAKDGYRVEVREKKDFDKIAFIEKQLQTTENVAFPPKRITDESVVCLSRE